MMERFCCSEENEKHHFWLKIIGFFEGLKSSRSWKWKAFLRFSWVKSLRLSSDCWSRIQTIPIERNPHFRWILCCFRGEKGRNKTPENSVLFGFHTLELHAEAVSCSKVIINLSEVTEWQKVAQEKRGDKPSGFMHEAAWQRDDEKRNN